MPRPGRVASGTQCSSEASASLDQEPLDEPAEEPPEEPEPESVENATLPDWDPWAPAVENDQAAQQAKAEREKRAELLTAAVLAEELALEELAAASTAGSPSAKIMSISGATEETGHAPAAKSKKD